jgi:hypothetical protein
MGGIHIHTLSVVGNEASGNCHFVYGSEGKNSGGDGEQDKFHLSLSLK